VSESIDIKLRRAALILADELNYPRAAEKLELSSAELRKQITALETRLYLHIFKPKQKEVELTKEGQFLIKLFRKSVALHDRNIGKDTNETPIAMQ